MPEGDTIHRTARTLRRVLLQRPILQARGATRHGVEPRALVGRTPVSLEARGKHLLLRLDDGQVLHSHMGMTGAWHVYRPGERWQKPGRQASLVLENHRWQVVCFSPPVLALLTERAVARHPVLSSLGPDLLSSAFDLAVATGRLASADHRPLGEALLDQRLVCGIGNVYKSEVLFLAGLDPFAPVSAVARTALAELLSSTRLLMARNMDGSPRTTRRATDGGRYWVYGRHGAPCRRCGELVRVRRQGEAGRTTYYCPTCQHVGGEALGRLPSS